MQKQVTFCDLRRKDVINVADGRSLGSIIDLVLDCQAGCVLGLVVPSEQNGFFRFFKCEEIFIPWQNICKIGEDVILVELFESYSCVNDASIQKLGNGKKEDKKERYYAPNYKYNAQNNPPNYEQPEPLSRKNIVNENYFERDV